MNNLYFWGLPKRFYHIVFAVHFAGWQVTVTNFWLWLNLCSVQQGKFVRYEKLSLSWKLPLTMGNPTFWYFFMENLHATKMFCHDRIDPKDSSFQYSHFDAWSHPVWSGRINFVIEKINKVLNLAEFDRAHRVTKWRISWQRKMQWLPNLVEMFTTTSTLRIWQRNMPLIFFRPKIVRFCCSDNFVQNFWTSETSWAESDARFRFYAPDLVKKVIFRNKMHEFWRKGSPWKRKFSSGLVIFFFLFFASPTGNFFPTDCFGSYEGPPVLVSTS